jgi:hypothetical protein
MFHYCKFLLQIKYIMLITLYKSALCPRCRLAKKYLAESLESIPGATLEEIDILSSPIKTWSAGVRMIPAIQIDQAVLSSVYLSREDVSAFINKHISTNSHQ